MDRNLKTLRSYLRVLGCQSGNIIVYIIAVMMLFTALGTALVSITTTSNIIAVAEDTATQEKYQSESIIRIAKSELKKQQTQFGGRFDKDSIISLNTADPYELSTGEKFRVNVFPKWFLSAGSYSVSDGQTIDINIPNSGKIPDGFFIGAGVHIVNIDGLRDSIIWGGDQSLFISEIGADSTNLDEDTMRIEVADPFVVNENQRVLMAVYPDSITYSSETQIITDGSATIVLDGSIDLIEAVFHKNGGTFYVLDPTTGNKRLYTYEKLSDSFPPTLVGVKGSDSPLFIDASRDIIIFSDYNHTIYIEGVDEAMETYAIEGAEADLEWSTSTDPILALDGPAENPSDIGIVAITQTAATPASTSGAVEIDTINQEIKLGLNVSSAYSAVWYGGTQNVGGVSGNFCSAGKCRFEYGMRAYFTVDYNGTGDGFTFALANGTDNSLTSVGGAGGSGELMGYAGPGTDGNGIKPPKMALEFDTYTNTGRNDPGSSNKDYLNFVYWGASDTDLNDDNVHDTWASISSTNGNIRSTPYVESSGDILVVSQSGYLYRMNAKGETIDSFNLGASSDSSPIVDGSGRIWVGTNDSYINVVNSTLTAFLGYPLTRNVGGNVRTIPAIDAGSGRVFFGTDYTGGASATSCNFCAMSLTGTLFPGFIYTGDVIQGSPFISGSSVYFGGNLGGGDVWSYTLTGSDNWGSPFTTSSDVFVRPVVSAGGKIYFGSWYNDRYFYSVSTAKVEQWRFDTGLVAIYSSAALDETRRRVYFGTGDKQSGGDDGKVYALNMDTGGLVWTYQTGGAIYSSPVVGADGAVMIGSNDGFLYAFEPDGTLRWKIDLKDDVRSSPVLSSGDFVVYVGSDENRLYSVPVTGNPWQFKTWEDDISGNTEYRYLTYGTATYPDPGNNLPNDAYNSGTISDADNWLNSGPWAVRVEVDRSQEPNNAGTPYENYDYVIRSWIRQCQVADCSDITGTYFSDTRIAYEAKSAQMTQSFALTKSDHDAFDTYYNGFTQATGGATQTVTIRNIRIGFVRPGDFVVTSDSGW